MILPILIYTPSPRGQGMPVLSTALTERLAAVQENIRRTNEILREAKKRDE